MAMVRRLLLLVPMLAISAFLSAAPEEAKAQTVSVTIENRSGLTLYYFYASGASNPSWENDLLGDYTLPHMTRQNFSFRNAQDCWYDFKFVFINGVEMTDQVNICQINTYTIRP